VTRVRRSEAADYVKLDDLLSAGVPPPPSMLGREDGRPWLVGAVLLAFLASAVVYMVLSMLGLRVPYPLIAAACLGVVLVRQAARAVGEPSWLHASDLVRPVAVRRRREPGSAYEGGDGVATEVRRWHRRLEWGVTGVVADQGRFARTVGAPLGELVDERLRQRHGITRATDQEQARAIVGENVWALLGHRQRLPTAREIAAAVADLDRI
jgi:hypothetical protein